MVTQYASAPLQVDSIFTFIHQVAPVPACWLFKTSAAPSRPLPLKVVSKSCATWATSVPILVFLGLSVLKLGLMYATDRRTSDRCQTKASLSASTLWGRRHNKSVHGLVAVPMNKPLLSTQLNEPPTKVSGLQQNLPYFNKHKALWGKSTILNVISTHSSAGPQ